jgi:hypothetical protein
MQAPTSFGLIGGIVFLAALALALAVAASAVLAVPLFLAALIVFLVWRGKRRAQPMDERSRARVPTTREAAADPAGDSGVRDAARSSSSHAA